MSQLITPTLDDVAIKIQNFLISIVPAGTPVVRGPVNRATLPKAPCVVFTYLFQNRLRTNLHHDTDPYPSPGGATGIEQGTKVHVQMDFYGDPSNDWALSAAMLWRDQYACDILAPEATPLYCDDARMIPLVTGEEQYLERYALTAMLQWNPVTSVAQQFADTLSVTLINADEAYPP